MDGIHDLGGRHGFGPVQVEQNEPVFHERWEAGVYTMVNRMMGEGLVKNVDQFRHSIERIDPVAYLSHGYYGRWLGGLENLLTESGVISGASLDERVVARGGSTDELVAARPDPAAPAVPAPEAQGAARTLANPPAFAVGQRVQTATVPVSGHTRLPAYARGRTGRVIAHQGGWVLPDSNAHGRGENPESLYCVEFSGEELWGAEAEAGQSVCLDLFESYLLNLEEAHS